MQRFYLSGVFVRLSATSYLVFTSWMVFQVNTIILTSEDEEVLNTDRTPYTQTGWRFILNVGDVAHATGNVVLQQQTANVTMDSVFLSMLSSLHLILRGKYFLLNCASNFHALIKVLVDEAGCSLMPRPMTVCLNEQVRIA